MNPPTTWDRLLRQDVTAALVCTHSYRDEHNFGAYTPFRGRQATYQSWKDFGKRKIVRPVAKCSTSTIQSDIGIDR